MSKRVSLWWRDLTYGSTRPGHRVTSLAVLGAVAGAGDTAVVILVIRLAARGRGLGDVPLVHHLPDDTGVLAVSAVVAALVLAAVHLVSSMLSARTGADAERHVRLDVLNAYLAASWSAQSAQRTGDVQELMMRNASQVAVGAQQAASALTAGLNLLVVLVGAVAVSLWSTLGVVVVGLLAICVVRPVRRRTRRLSQASAAIAADLAADVTEMTELAREVAVFGVTEPVRAGLGRKVDAAARHTEQVRTASSALPMLTRDVTIVAVIIGIAFVVARAEVALALIGATVILLVRALGHLQTMIGVAQSLVDRDANLERVRDHVDAWRASAVAVAGTRPCEQVGEVTMRGVAFRYPGGERSAIRDVDLVLQRGEQLGVIGPTGAGKTTFAGVLLGVLAPDEGQVEVDGTPLVELDPAAWRARSAWVPQEPRLLTGTVADNIRFLRPLDDDAVLDAARRAGLGAELAIWSEGLDRDAGPAGRSLSGGQRQRIALARALAGRPDLLVLDEPTSALDAHTEVAVRDALAELRGEVTVVVIAHRLSTLAACDRVVVFDEGRVVTSGPPSELEATSAYYRDVRALSGLR